MAIVAQEYLLVTHDTPKGPISSTRREQRMLSNQVCMALIELGQASSKAAANVDAHRADILTGDIGR
jgi:hypothetical protein